MLEISGPTPAMVAAAEHLHHADGARRVRVQPAFADGRSFVFAELRHDTTDEILRQLLTLGLPRESMSLTSVQEIGVTRGGGSGLIWADVVGVAGSTRA